MANKKKAAKRERSSTSRERRLALALRAILDAAADSNDDAKRDALADAGDLLHELGYGEMVGIPKRVAALNEQLTAALSIGDGKEIARLGLELERAKTGKPPLAANKNNNAPERKPSQKRKAETGTAVVRKVDPWEKCICGAVFDSNVHHLPSAPNHHTFEPAGEAIKGVGA